MAYTNIDDPSAHFQALTYTGNGTTTNNVTNTGNSNLQPDWIWIKQRNATEDHVVTDTSRDGEVDSGTNIVLAPNTNEAEATSTGFGINPATNGINFDASWHKVNENNSTFVAWQWKANGGTTSTNNDGNHTSVVQANQDAGFSIVTYTGTGNTSSTVGHGLGVTPNWIIFKRRSGTGNWDVQIDGTSRVTLNLTEPFATNVLSSFSSTTFGLGSVTSNEKNANGSTYLAYCFASKQGYSKFGQYVGNGNADGTFVYTGFKPAFVLTKRTDTTGNWLMHDNKRIGHNPNNYELYANLTNVEEDNDRMDILSNGFKMRLNNADSNASGGTYIFMAFAENPFVTSTGIPTTAR